MHGKGPLGAVIVAEHQTAGRGRSGVHGFFTGMGHSDVPSPTESFTALAASITQIGQRLGKSAGKPRSITSDQMAKRRASLREKGLRHLNEMSCELDHQSYCHWHRH